jgi:ABC-type xylose transport system permease subunit
LFESSVYDCYRISTHSVVVREEIRLSLGTLALLCGLLALGFALRAYNNPHGFELTISCGASVVLAALAGWLALLFYRNGPRVRLAERTRIRHILRDLKSDLRIVRRK